MPRMLLARIALLSAFILFVEMMLVRWVGTELRVFAYLQNGVLVAAFLGLGLGARNSRAPVRVLGAVVALAAVALVIRDPFHLEVGEAVTNGLVGFEDAVWYAAGGGLPNYVRTALVTFSVAVSFGLLAAIAWCFRPLGQWLGAWMDQHPRPIAAYTANILGSLVGIGAFVVATVLRTSPRAWLVVAGVGFALLVPAAADRAWARIVAAVAALALPWLAPPADPLTVWSPYQKLQVVPHKEARLGGGGTCGESILVNGVGYQNMVNLDPAHAAAHPDLYPQGALETSSYTLPYRLLGRRERVLIVGGGAGNDAAGALRAGAGTVHAVEIDPAIVEIGRSRHPERPYASPKVRVVVDDARAFFGKDRGQYDLIWFGLLDSHTTPSAYANVRLDHFVYTQESLRAARARLAPGGVIVLYFAAQTEWIAQRLATLLAVTFDAPPLGYAILPPSTCLGWGGLMLVGGTRETLDAVRAGETGDLRLRPRDLNVAQWKPVAPNTDDWPYLYLRNPGLPRYHMLVAAACLALAALLRRRLFAEGAPSDATMLLLGMGFMLLEITGVSRAALLFGTTWTVNAYVVGAILAMVLLANLVASRFPVADAAWPKAGLMLSLVALACVPAEALAALPLATRVVAGAGFLALPVFFSGLVFVTAWARAERKDLALGSNLLGSLLGGIASMLSMVIGFRGLALLTILTYLGALVATGRRRPAGAGEAPAA